LDGVQSQLCTQSEYTLSNAWMRLTRAKLATKADRSQWLLCERAVHLLARTAALGANGRVAEAWALDDCETFLTAMRDLWANWDYGNPSTSGC
jgi:hypothetical protein